MSPVVAIGVRREEASELNITVPGKDAFIRSVEGKVFVRVGSVRPRVLGFPNAPETHIVGKARDGLRGPGAQHLTQAYVGGGHTFLPISRGEGRIKLGSLRPWVLSFPRAPETHVAGEARYGPRLRPSPGIAQRQ